jgi:uncharacterized protein YdeI (YjbR/CyaY-like superfamily)
MERYFLVDHLDVDRLLSGWRWLCPQTLTLVARSAFGDLFLRDETGKFFKLDIAIGKLTEVAQSETEFRKLAGTKEKREEWFAESDELAAMKRGLKPNQDQCIALKIPIVFAEGSGPNNSHVGSLYERLPFLGDLNRQLSQDPAGYKVQLRIRKRDPPQDREETGSICVSAMPPKATFFPTPSDFRAWFEANHDKSHELLVGFHKRDSGKPSITWPESVQVALCFGWIDGIRKSLDETSYTIRFTPRRPTSNWSSINIKFVHELTEKGLMHAAGLKAFAARNEKKSAIYSYERKSAQLTREQEKQFRANKAAWEFFRSQAPWYQRVTTFWVISAKREETKLKRLSELIRHSQNQRRIPGLIPTKKK